MAARLRRSSYRRPRRPPCALGLLVKPPINLRTGCSALLTILQHEAILPVLSLDCTLLSLYISLSIFASSSTMVSAKWTWYVQIESLLSLSLLKTSSCMWSSSKGGKAGIRTAKLPLLSLATIPLVSSFEVSCCCVANEEEDEVPVGLRLRWWWKRFLRIPAVLTVGAREGAFEVMFGGCLFSSRLILSRAEEGQWG